MNIDIFIVSVAKHFNYLPYCLRSIGKFAHAFSALRVAIPRTDASTFNSIQRDYERRNIFGPRLHLILFDEWPNHGMMHHEYEILRSDIHCQDADAVLHMDSDMVFLRDVDPDTFTCDGKPVMLIQDWDSLLVVDHRVEAWRTATLNAIGYCDYETMRAPPLFYKRNVYAATRDEITRYTKMPLDQYMIAQTEAWPQSFCEFVTLGNVALRHFPSEYHVINVAEDGYPPQYIRQAWSHQPPTREDINAYARLGIYD